MSTIKNNIELLQEFIDANVSSTTNYSEFNMRMKRLLQNRYQVTFYFDDREEEFTCLSQDYFELWQAADRYLQFKLIKTKYRD